MIKNVLCRRVLFTLALFCFATANAVYAVSLYKWVDENGRVHYSQTPPEKSAVQQKQLQVKDSNPYQNQQQENSEPKEKKENAPATTDAAAKVVETRKKNCEIARHNLEVYKNSAQVVQEDGTTITLSDEMRTAKVKEAQAMVNAYCN